MKKILLTTIILTMAVITSAQIEFGFTAIHNQDHVQLDSIKVVNRDKACDTTLYYPDTILILYPVLLNENFAKVNGFNIYQNYPNPVSDQTTVEIEVPDNGTILIDIRDISGRLLDQYEFNVDAGMNSFIFCTGKEKLYFLTAWFMGQPQTIKILSKGSPVNRCSIEYKGKQSVFPGSSIQLKSSAFEFEIGDRLVFIGFIEGIQSGISDSPENSKDYTLQFATNIPCPGIPTVTYEGQVYNTIQIYSQCWLKENLNVGIKILGSEDMQDDGVIEKYCYNDLDSMCNEYGALYQWREMMDYVEIPGARGICPEGWHVPTNEEWKVLEGTTDSIYKVCDPMWDNEEQWRGFNAGDNLKAQYSWTQLQGKDKFGFKGLGSGVRNENGGFIMLGFIGPYFVSNIGIPQNAYAHTLSSNDSTIFLDGDNPFNTATALRCIKDN